MQIYHFKIDFLQYRDAKIHHKSILILWGKFRYFQVSKKKKMNV